MLKTDLPPARNFTLKCLECDKEKPATCNQFKTITDCASIDVSKQIGLGKITTVNIAFLFV